MTIFKIAIGVVIGFVMLFFAKGAYADAMLNDKTGVLFHLFFLVLIGFLTYIFLV